MHLDVYDHTRNKVSEVVVADGILNAPIKTHLLHDVVRMQLANRRKGTACVKNRASVRGGGRKPWRQKGTGRARAGTIRSPLWRGGGTVFGPIPRDYSYSLPKKVKRAGLLCALSLKYQEGKFLVVENLELPSIKTKLFVEILGQLEIENCLVVDSANKNLELSARNIPCVKVLPPKGLNVYDLLRYEHVLITREGLEQVERLLGHERSS